MATPPTSDRALSAAQIAARLRDRLRESSSPEAPEARPLQHLTDPGREPVLEGLVEGWAELLHVLEFHQDRIVEESTLDSARQERSILELTAAMGLTPMPGVSASGLLSFTVLPAEDGGVQSVLIPEGTRADGPAGDDGQVPAFETTRALVGHSDWNSVGVTEANPTAIPPRLEIPSDGAPLGLRIAASNPTVQGDDFLLVTGRSPGDWWLLRVEAARSVTNGAEQELELSVSETEAPSSGGEPWALVDPKVQLFRKRARFFEAVAWESNPAKAGLDRLRLGADPLTTLNSAPSWRRCPLHELGEVRCLVSDDQGRVFAGTRGKGVFRSSDGGESWEAVSAGLAHTNVFALAFSTTVGLLAGTDGGAVYRSTDGGGYWSSLAGGTVEERLTVPGVNWTKGPFYVYNRDGQLVSGVQTPGVKSIDPATTRRLFAPARALAIDDHDPEHPAILVGTDAGAMLSVNLGVTWWLESEGLFGYDTRSHMAGVAMRCACYHPQLAAVLAGTDKGLYAWNQRARKWYPVPLEGTEPEITAVAPLGSRWLLVGALIRQTSASGTVTTPALYLLEATTLVTYRSARGASQVQLNDALSFAKARMRADGGAELGQVFDLDVAPYGGQSVALAATATGVWWLSFPDSGTPTPAWKPLSGELSKPRSEPLAPRHAVAIARGHRWSAVCAGAPVTLALEDWEGLESDQAHLDLDATYPDLSGSSDLILLERRAGAAQLTRRVHVSSVESRVRSAQGITREVTRARLSAAAPTEFTLDAELLCQPELLPVRFSDSGDLSVSGGDALALRGRRSPLEPGRLVLVGGRPLELWVKADTPGLEAWPGAVDGVYALELVGVDGLSSAAPTWTVRHPETGAPTDLVLALEQVQVLPREEPEWELCEVVETQAAGDTTHLRLRKFTADPSATTRPLERAYDTGSLQVLGNLAPANHGATQPELPIGGGDPTLPGQRFPLPQRSLSATRDPLSGALTPALDVRVDRFVRWRQATPTSTDPRRFEVRVRSDGGLALEFGDGVGGARLPAGFNNVTVVAREGAGRVGNLPARSLRQLVGAPSGVDAVDNPLPTRGGVDPEAAAALRARIGPTLRTMGQAASLVDLQDFLLLQPEVGACVLTDKGDHVVVTVADRAGRPFDPDDDAFTIRGLQRVAEAAGWSGRLRFTGFALEPFDLSMHVAVDPAWLPAPTLERLRAHLTAALSDTHGALRTQVTGAEVLALAHGVPGVQGVRLTRLRKGSGPDGPNPSFAELSAAPDSTGRAHALTLGSLTLEPWADA